MSVTALPTPPTRSDPTTFASRADAFMAAIPTFATEVNALQTDVNAKQVTATTAATTATTQASNAATSAASASSAATDAINAKNEAIALTESYQGSLSSDPSLDKHGGALSAGDWYINSATGYIRVYNGSTWVQGVSAVSGVTSLNGQTGPLTGFVTESGTQTLTNKTLTNALGSTSGLTLNDGYTEEVFAITGTTPALSPNNGSIQTWTLTANSTPTFGTFNNGQSVLFGITSGSYTVTWPSITWSKVGGSGTAPTLTSTGVNWIVLWKVSGTVRGSFLGTA